MLRRTPSPETEVTIREPIREGSTAAEYQLDTWQRPPLVVTLPEGVEPIIGVEHATGTWRELRFEHLTLSLDEAKLLVYALRRALHYHKRQQQQPARAVS